MTNKIKRTYKFYLEKSIYILKKKGSYFSGDAAGANKESFIKEAKFDLKNMKKLEVTVEDLIDLFYVYDQILYDNQHLIGRDEFEKTKTFKG